MIRKAPVITKRRFRIGDSKRDWLVDDNRPFGGGSSSTTASRRRSCWTKCSGRPTCSSPSRHRLTGTGDQVDLVLEQRSGTIAGIEVKSAATVTASDFKGLRPLSGNTLLIRNRCPSGLTANCCRSEIWPKALNLNSSAGTPGRLACRGGGRLRRGVLAFVELPAHRQCHDSSRNRQAVQGLRLRPAGHLHTARTDRKVMAMWEDSIVKETRAAREELFARFNHDLAA